MMFEDDDAELDDLVTAAERFTEESEVTSDRMLRASSPHMLSSKEGLSTSPLSPSTAARAPSRCCRSAISCSLRRRPASSRCARPTGGPRSPSTLPAPSRSTASCTRAARCASTALGFVLDARDSWPPSVLLVGPEKLEAVCHLLLLASTTNTCYGLRAFYLYVSFMPA